MSKLQRADKVLEYILKNASKLSPEKIEALSKVLDISKDINEATHEPNTIPEVENHDDLMEEQPVDLSDVEGISVDGRKVKTKIYKA